MWQADNHKAVVQRYVAAYNAHDLAAMDGIFASTYVDHAQPDGQPPQPPGPAFKKQIFALFFQSFPDAYLTLEDLIAEGDRVVARLRMSGTHQGAFMGIRPKGRRFSVPAINIFLIRDGMITDSWGVIDMMTLIQQIKGPPMVEFIMGRSSSLLEEKLAPPEWSRPAPLPEYWARWEYSPEEWKRFDQVDWGGALRTFFASLGIFVLLFSSLETLFWIYIVPNIVFRAGGSAFGDGNGGPVVDKPIIPLLLMFFIMPLILLSILIFSFFIHPFQEARKRHRVRKADSRRVTIGNLSSSNNQGLWLAGFFVPLQDFDTKLNTVKITSQPLVLHLRRKHLEIQQFTWYDTIRVLIPHGHEAEAAQLVERFRVETMQFQKKDTSPREP